jgi:hypothetical protein
MAIKWLWSCTEKGCPHRGYKPTDRSTAGHDGRKHMKDKHGISDRDPIFQKIIMPKIDTFKKGLRQIAEMD